MKRSTYFLLFLLIMIIAEISFGSGFILKKEDVKQENSYVNNQPEKFFHILTFDIKTKEIYLALNDTKQIEYELEIDSNYEEPLMIKSKNENIASVDELGVVTAKNLGTTTIELKIKEEIRTIEVTVTDLINKIPEKYNKNKYILPCNKYSEEQNDLLDKILKNRVEEAGISTRAGVIAAARFLTLEFPYKIGYFSENGRIDKNKYTNYVDGEGRYYHEGLYLHKSRFKNIAKSMYGPNIWGCPIYSYVSEGTRRNGFDCSGYIAWVLLNGGFNPGDIGAGISNVLTDMTDLGEKKNLTSSIKNMDLKAGDLLSGPNPTGGHIAMIIGLKEDKIYVTECLWGNIGYGAIISTYSMDSLKNNFKWYIDMDDYYKEEGKYTEYWI